MESVEKPSYYERNKERLKQYQKDHYDPEVRRVKQKVYYKTHKKKYEQSKRNETALRRLNKIMSLLDKLIQDTSQEAYQYILNKQNEKNEAILKLIQEKRDGQNN